METKIQKWGNSLAIRIPKSFAKEAKIEYNSEVELSIDNNVLIITPIKIPKYDLDVLLENITEENIHGEVDTELPQGKELL